LDNYFSHCFIHPQSGPDWFLCGATGFLHRPCRVSHEVAGIF
jgi:hypothetical protein